MKTSELKQEVKEKHNVAELQSKGSNKTPCCGPECCSDKSGSKKN